ncbi:hypothetical protein RRG08_046081 [Elysia crispata]|uniref:Uncharacterized protein n=1 Tax=Elysia crispata TaxID=231223 RepID=A0AAE1CT89_9GAST|nr:hypothetical protein RRG08_046081 [Elysia crispata]
MDTCFITGHRMWLLFKLGAQVAIQFSWECAFASSLKSKQGAGTSDSHLTRLEDLRSHLLETGQRSGVKAEAQFSAVRERSMRIGTLLPVL